jgi:hypothetical protein
VEEQAQPLSQRVCFFYVPFFRQLDLAAMWARVANAQVVRVEKAQVPLLGLRGVVVVGLLLLSGDFLVVVPVPVVWFPMALPEGLGLEQKPWRVLERMVVRCRCGHQVAS